jgi:hypothetical protein
VRSGTRGRPVRAACTLAINGSTISYSSSRATNHPAAIDTPEGAARVLAAWVCHLRDHGAPITDARADAVVPLAAGPLRDAVPRVLPRWTPRSAPTLAS